MFSRERPRGAERGTSTFAVVLAGKNDTERERERERERRRAEKIIYSRVSCEKSVRYCLLGEKGGTRRHERDVATPGASAAMKVRATAGNGYAGTYILACKQAAASERINRLCNQPRPCRLSRTTQPSRIGVLSPNRVRDHETSMRDFGLFPIVFEGNEMANERDYKSRRVSKEIWAVVNSEFLRADEVWSSAGMKGRGKRETSEKIRRPAAASSGTIPTCENQVIWPEIEPGSPWWETSVLTVQPSWSVKQALIAVDSCSIRCTSSPGRLRTSQGSESQGVRNERERGESAIRAACIELSPPPPLGDIPLPTSQGHHPADPHRRTHIQNLLAGIPRGDCPIHPPHHVQLQSIYCTSVGRRGVGGRNVDGRASAARFSLASVPSEPIRVIEVSMEQRRSEGPRETGDPRENPPTNGIVRHDSHVRKSRVTRQGIEPVSPWWEESRLTTQPPWPPFRVICLHRTVIIDVISLLHVETVEDVSVRQCVYVEGFSFPFLHSAIATPYGHFSYYFHGMTGVYVSHFETPVNVNLSCSYTTAKASVNLKVFHMRRVLEIAERLRKRARLRYLLYGQLPSVHVKPLELTYFQDEYILAVQRFNPSTFLPAPSASRVGYHVTDVDVVSIGSHDERKG
ncbi:hypothetical protein PR048_016722 [Dryococelus australis]|uniref:Uncharacterized protein n=1 Tax=Dryococelus australis TaxID=614101 RepID=A0ABQ9H7L2_9NEOP|nr:hypothetical protein PR048_016722 [Dryococelus australis]